MEEIIEQLEYLKIKTPSNEFEKGVNLGFDTAINLLRAETVTQCKWNIDEINEGFITGCGHGLTIFNNSDDLIKDFQDIGYKHCPYCAELIEIHVKS